MSLFDRLIRDDMIEINPYLVFATVHSRWPSVSRRRGTNMEQRSSLNDIIKFPENVQKTKLKSHLFLASFT